MWQTAFVKLYHLFNSYKVSESVFYSNMISDAVDALERTEEDGQADRLQEEVVGTPWGSTFNKCSNNASVEKY